MTLDEYQVLRDSNVRLLFKSGATFSEIRNRWAIDDDFIIKICRGTVRLSSPQIKRRMSKMELSSLEEIDGDSLFQNALQKNLHGEA